MQLYLRYFDFNGDFIHLTTFGSEFHLDLYIFEYSNVWILELGASICVVCFRLTFPVIPLEFSMQRWNREPSPGKQSAASSNTLTYPFYGLLN